MQLKLDADVQAVAQFMQTNIPADKLVATAEAMAKLAPLLWDGDVLQLRSHPIPTYAQQTRLTASE